MDVLPGSIRLSGESKERITFNRSGVAAVTHYLTLDEMRHDDVGGADRGKFEIKINSREAFSFTLDDCLKKGAYLEINPNKSQSVCFSMEKDAGAGQSVCLDMTDYQDEVIYRFISDGSTIVDPLNKYISFIPNVGVCHILEKGDAFQVYLEIPPTLLPAEKKRKKKIQTDSFVVSSHPDWMTPTAKEFFVKSDGGLTLQFKIKSITDLGTARNDLIQIVSKDGRKRIDLDVEVLKSSTGIQATLKKAEIQHRDRETWGSEVTAQVPFIVQNAGKMELHFKGPGVNQRHTINNQNPEPHEYSVPVVVDTSRISPFTARNLKLLLHTDEKLANRRDAEITLRLNLASLRVFPTSRLVWCDCSYGSRPSQVLEFFDAATAEPVETVKAQIPETLKPAIAVEPVAGKPNALNVCLETRKVPIGATLKDRIKITGTSRDHLVLKQEIEVVASPVHTRLSLTVTVDGDNEPRVGPIVCVTVRNIGDHPLHLFNIFWEKGLFLRHTSNGSGIKAEKNIIAPGKSFKRCYCLAKGAAYFRRRRITDFINLHTNDMETPQRRCRVDLVLPPLTWLRKYNSPVVTHKDEQLENEPGAGRRFLTYGKREIQ